MFFINPFILSPAGGDFESIATVTVGSGGASSIEFTSIPSTYQHLQIRGIARTDRGLASDVIYVQLNADTSSNYAYHNLYGNGGGAGADAASSQTKMSTWASATGSTASASMFGALVMDVLDYASTTKNKTVRTFSGHERNGAGDVAVSSGLWMSTSAVTSVQLTKIGSNFVQHTTFGLYGVKAP